MKILVVNMGPIYPLRAMNQVRTHNMMRVLSEANRVDLATPSNSPEERESSVSNMAKLGGEYIDLGTVKPVSNIFKKRYQQVLERSNYYLFATDPEVTHSLYFKKRLLALVKDYDVVISNYWEGSLFFCGLHEPVLKILDPHYSVAENYDVFNSVKKTPIERFFTARKLKKNSAYEKRVLLASDAALPLSERGYKEFREIAPAKPLLLVPDGNDLDYFSDYHVSPEPKTILFYGAMGSLQNQKAFFRFYYNILPRIKEKVPDVRLLVVGANPPGRILDLHDGDSTIVTGFVEDVRPWLAKACFKIIPLEHGSGFRGRVVELLAMGIPVVGTHNALDSIGGCENDGILISDQDEQLVNYSLDLIKKNHYRSVLSSKAKEFVKNKYSLNAAFGGISTFLNNLSRSK